MKHQVIHLGKGQASFFLQYYIGVCDGVEWRKMDLKGYLYYIFVQPTSKSYCTFLC